HSHFPNERTSGKFVLEHRIACCNFGRWGAKVFLTFLAAQARCGVESDDSTNKVRQSPSSRRDVQRQAILRHVQHQPRTVDVIHSEGTLRSPHDNIKQKLKKFWELDSIGIQHHEECSEQLDMDFDTVYRETRSGRNERQILVLPDPDASEPETVSGSSDEETIDEDDASANAKRKSYIWRRRPFNPKTEAFIGK
ncbi:hypothetical protein T02_9056, partial [Trichinella nativa]